MNRNSGTAVSTSLDVTSKVFCTSSVKMRLLKNSWPGRVVGVVAEAHTHGDEREGDRKAEHDDEDEEKQHRQTDLRVGHAPLSFCPGSWLHDLAALALELLLADDYAFGLLHVMQALRPVAEANAQNAADDLGDALDQQQHAGHRNEGLERKHRHAGGAEDAHLAELHGEFGIGPARVDPGGDRREEEEDVEQQVHHGLRARPPEAIEHVGAHVLVSHQRIGAGHQEHGAVGDVADVERPGRRRAQDVAHEDLVADAQREHEDQPTEGLADPRAERVDEEQKSGHDRWIRSQRRIARPPIQRVGRRGFTPPSPIVVGTSVPQAKFRS